MDINVLGITVDVSDISVYKGYQCIRDISVFGISVKASYQCIRDISV